MRNEIRKALESIMFSAPSGTLQDRVVDYIADRLDHERVTAAAFVRACGEGDIADALADGEHAR